MELKVSSQPRNYAAKENSKKRKKQEKEERKLGKYFYLTIFMEYIFS